MSHVKRNKLWLLILFILGPPFIEKPHAQTERFSVSYNVPQTPFSFGLARTFLKKDSGGYLVLGTSRTNGYWGRKMVLFDLNEQGDTLHTSVIGGGEWENFWSSLYADAFTRAKDSGYYISGIYEDTTGLQVPILYRIGPSLDTMWTRRYHRGDTLQRHFHAIERLPSGNLVTAGWEEGSGQSGRALFLKLNPQGQILWEETIGGPDSMVDWRGYSIEYTSDGGLIATGGIIPKGPVDFDDSDPKGLLVNMDTTGNIEWQRTFKGGLEGLVGNMVLTTKDSGYVIGGTEAITETQKGGFIRKYGQNGDSLWNERYIYDTTGNYYASSLILKSLVELDDGSLLTAGFRKLAPILPEEKDSTEDGWILKTDAQGQPIWNRYHRHAVRGDFRLYDIQSTEKGMMAVGLSNDANSTNDESGNAWMLKLDSMGCLRPDCAVGVRAFQEKNAQGLKIYPNPASERVFIEFPERIEGGGILRVYNMKGRLVREKKVGDRSRIHMDLSERSKGVYIARYIRNGMSLSERFMIR